MSPLEPEARKLRDNIYGPQSDEAWEHVRERWISDIDWLRLNQPKDL